MPTPHVTECFLLRTALDGMRQVMLGRKKTGVGAGKIVGIGGKIEPGETPSAAAVRELREETGVVVSEAELDFRGIADFRFPNKAAYTMIAHVFVCERWQGQPTETDEIAPVWYPIHHLPFDLMWADAQHWLSGVLRGGRINGVFIFNDDNETLKEFRMLNAEV